MFHVHIAKKDLIKLLVKRDAFIKPRAKNYERGNPFKIILSESDYKAIFCDYV